MLQLSCAETVSSGARRPNPVILHAVAETAFPDLNPQPVMIELGGVSKSFGPRERCSVTAVDGITLRIPEHSITLITGPNGSGKTTLLARISHTRVERC